MRPLRQLSSQRKLTASQLRKQRNQLAASSLRDVFEAFGSSSQEEDWNTENFDPKPVYDNPSNFYKISFAEQQHIVKELQEKWLLLNWSKVPHGVKAVSYLVAYGNYGPREKFDSKPADLPFKTPSFITETSPNAETLVRPVAPVSLNLCTEERRKQYNKERKMDPVSKTVIFVCAILTVINFKRDRRINNTNTVPLNEYEIYLQKKPQEEEEAERVYAVQDVKNGEKKWYYLWLK